MDTWTHLIGPDGYQVAQPAGETAPDDETVAVAKSLGTGVYFVRATAEGALFNPIEGDRLAQKDRDRSGPKFKFHRCGIRCFDTYVRYLKNRQRPDYNIAQRGFVDGD